MLSGPARNQSDAEGRYALGAVLHPDAVALIEDILQRGVDVRMEVTGRSMAPFLNSGTVVTIGSADVGSLKPGDLILFKNSAGRPVLHRIIRTRNLNGHPSAFLTKGDALRNYDEPVPADRVMGKVVNVEKRNVSGHVLPIDLTSRRWIVRNRILAVVHLFYAATDGRYARHIPQAVRAAGNRIIQWLHA